MAFSLHPRDSLLVIPDPFLSSARWSKVYVYQNKGLGYETFMLVNLVAIVLSGISYVIWSLLLLRRHRKTILDQFSYTEKINLRWLQFLIYGIAIIWTLVFTREEILFAGVVLFVVLIGYFGIKQPGIFIAQRVNEVLMTGPEQPNVSTIQPETESVDQSIGDNPFAQDIASTDKPAIERQTGNVNQDENTEKRKYLKSGLTAEMAGDLHNRLKKMMEAENIYTESELSLSELASRLNTLPNYLSQVINDKEGKLL
jgi:hypothetical protein